MAISRRAEPRQIPSVSNIDGNALLGCRRRGATCRMAPAAGDKVRPFDRGHDTDPTGRAKVPGDSGEVVEVRQVDDTAAMVNVSQDVTPTEHPPAGIRIARSSDRPDLTKKAGTATQKFTISTREDGDTT